MAVLKAAKSAEYVEERHCLVTNFHTCSSRVRVGAEDGKKQSSLCQRAASGTTCAQWSERAFSHTTGPGTPRLSTPRWHQRAQPSVAVMEGSVGTVPRAYVFALSAPRTGKRCRPVRARTKRRGTDHRPPGKGRPQSAGQRQRRRRAAPPGLGLSAAPALPPPNALARRERLWPGASPFGTSGEGGVVKRLASRRLTALAPRAGVARVRGFCDGRGGMGPTVRCQCGRVFWPRTPRSLTRPFFPSLPSALPRELAVVAERVLGNVHYLRALAMRESRTLQPQRVHSPLN